MSSFNWLAFLTQWSQDILNSRQMNSRQTPNTHSVTDEAQKHWLGYPGASEDQIKAAEVRLGKKLPPSYRAFLKVSNGWQETTPFIQDLGSTEEINWFAIQHSDWLKQWIQLYHTAPPAHANGATAVLQVSDQDYFIYGESQDCRKLRINYLKKTLTISGVKDASVYLLNPEVVTEDGEWEAWFLADWLPGADRYPSFQELMQAEYINSREIRSTSSELGSDNADDDSSTLLNIGQIWLGLSPDDVQGIIQQAFSSQESSSFAAQADHQVEQVSEPQPVSPMQICSQQWPGIEVDKVCQWIVAQVEQTVCPEC